MLLSSSAIIEDIRAFAENPAGITCALYCIFGEGQKKDVHGLFSSLLVQLDGQSDIYSATLFDSYVTHGLGLQPGMQAMMNF